MLMRSSLVEVRVGVLLQHAFERPLVQDQNVVQAFATNASEKSLTHRVHIRSAHGCLHDSHPDALRYAIELSTEFPVTVANDHVGTFTEGSDLPKLLRRPNFARRTSHGDVDDFFGIHIDDEEREDRSKPAVIELQEIASPHVVTLEKRRPCLAAAGWGARPSCSAGP